MRVAERLLVVMISTTRRGHIAAALFHSLSVISFAQLIAVMRFGPVRLASDFGRVRQSLSVGPRVAAECRLSVCWADPSSEDFPQHAVAFKNLAFAPPAAEPSGRPAGWAS